MDVGSVDELEQGPKPPKPFNKLIFLELAYRLGTDLRAFIICWLLKPNSLTLDLIDQLIFRD
jgi:hypothetical protein